MQFSAFGEKFTQHSGILQLMDDLGDALKKRQARQYAWRRQSGEDC